VVHLWNAVFGYGTAHNAPALVIDRKLDAADGLFVVAVLGDQVLGTVMAGYDGHRGWIYALAVRPERRREGLGSRLLAAAERVLASRGCVKINLQVVEGNDGARLFYEARGYVAESRLSMGKLVAENVPAAVREPGAVASGGAPGEPRGAERAFQCRAIGVIRSPHTRAEETPIQPSFAKGVPGRVEMLPEYEAGLRDIEGFSHIYLVYAFDRAGPCSLETTPCLGDRPRGVFATRAPSRPNGLGLSLVRLVRREGAVLHVEDVDILDGTPLLDIKPFIGRFDSREDAVCGWQDDVDDETATREGRRGFRGSRRRGGTGG